MNQYKSVTFSVNNDVPNTFLAAQMRSLLVAQYHLNTVQCLKLIHDKRKLSVSDIKRSKLKRINLVLLNGAFYILDLNVSALNIMILSSPFCPRSSKTNEF